MSVVGINEWDCFSSLTPDDLSVEVNNDHRYALPNPFEMRIDSYLQVFSDLGQDLGETQIDGICESSDFIQSISQPYDSDELDKCLGFNVMPIDIDNKDDVIKDWLDTFNATPFNEARSEVMKSEPMPIYYPSFIDESSPTILFKQPHSLKIVHGLEETYRLRYKSDYFAQSGKSRKPRYVADCKGNHFITLQVPEGVDGNIRVDWLTIPTAEDGTRYSMPYKFQIDNDSYDVPDCNPAYYKIKADSSGIMKLYLVLIKAKQDALKSLQPLKPFQPFKDVFGITDKSMPERTAKLTPKKLIEKYQLTKSQLAFTLCTTSNDGKSYIPDWSTTVYSSVLSETSTEESTKRIVACPKCSFEIDVSDQVEATVNSTTKKRKIHGQTFQDSN